MAFNPKTAKPVQGGFNPATAKPIDQSFDAMQMVKNIPSSAGTFGKNIASAVMHPIDTAKGLVRTAAGGIGAAADKIVPGSSTAYGSVVTPEDTQAWNNFKDFFKKRYGGIEETKQTIQNDPVGFASDAAAALGMAGGAIGKTGELSGINALTKAGEATTSAGEVLNPMNAARGTARLAGEYIGKPVSEGIAGLSGIQQNEPGTLAAEFKDPSLILSPGTKTVSKMYESAKTEPIPSEFTETPKVVDFVDQSLKAAEEGKLNAETALEARKAVRSVQNRLNPIYFQKAVKTFDEIAKPKFSQQDIAYQRGSQAEAMRNIFPINKDGEASIGRSAIAAGLGGGAHAAGVNPAFALALSPAVQGLTAGALGAGAKAASPIAQLLIDHPELSAILGKSKELGLSGQLKK